MKTIIKTLAAGIIMSAFFISCQTTRNSTAVGWNYNNSFPGGFEKTQTENQNKSPLAQSPELKNERVVIYNATINLTVKVADSANARLSLVAQKYSGYVQKLSTDYSVIRVKSENLDKALNEISRLGKVTYKNVSGDDVTEEYKDLKIRLENAEKARSRYLELLAKAQNVDETLKVEKELERLNGEIDLLKGRMNNVTHLSEYSTIHINLQQKTKPGIVGYVFVGLYKGVKWLFVRN